MPKKTKFRKKTLKPSAKSKKKVAHKPRPSVKKQPKRNNENHGRGDGLRITKSLQLIRFRLSNACPRPTCRGVVEYGWYEPDSQGYAECSLCKLHLNLSRSEILDALPIA
jgi:hypothetical protein